MTEPGTGPEVPHGESGRCCCRQLHAAIGTAGFTERLAEKDRRFRGVTVARQTKCKQNGNIRVASLPSGRDRRSGMIRSQC